MSFCQQDQWRKMTAFQLRSFIKTGDKTENPASSHLFLRLERTYLEANLMNFTENKEEDWQVQLNTCHLAPFLANYTEKCWCAWESSASPWIVKAKLS